MRYPVTSEPAGTSSSPSESTEDASTASGAPSTSVRSMKSCAQLASVVCSRVRSAGGVLTSSWLVAGLVPGLAREPLKKQGPDPVGLLRLLERWRAEAAKAGKTIARIVVAFEAGRDGFWLARWLLARGIETCVIHPTSIPVSREHRRAKSDRIDTQLLKRSFLGWLRGEAKHCSMAAIPTLAQEDARRANREHETLVGERTRLANWMTATLTRFGVRGFNVKLKRAAERLAALRGAEGEPLPPNTLAELRRDMARLELVKQQIK